jgi:hypothetical protein
VIEIVDCVQGTPEWHAARRGLPTASEFHKVLAKGEGKTRNEYMRKLVGELVTGECEEGYSNGYMERGKAQEADARDLYAFHRGLEPQLVGFVRNGPKGCSPDSLIGANGMVEIKTKMAHLQVDVLLRNRIPPEHMAQLQGNLWVAEREWIDFVSYRPRMPLFVKRMFRDEAYIKNLAKEVDIFLAEMVEMHHKVSDYAIAEAA